MMKRYSMFLLVLLLSITFFVGSAFSYTLDFRSNIWDKTYPSVAWSEYYSDIDLTVTMVAYEKYAEDDFRPNGALTWNPGDGIGIENSYEYDEIEAAERLFVVFSKGMYLSEILITDLFNENGYQERGFYYFKKDPVTWDSDNYDVILADLGQVPGSSNGELSVPLVDELVWGIGFGSLGRVDDENHEFSLASLEVNPVPEPATMILLGTGLVGLAGLRRQFKK